MLAAVHRGPPPSANRANTIRVTAGERGRTGVNEPKTEPTPKRHLRPEPIGRDGVRQRDSRARHWGAPISLTTGWMPARLPGALPRAWGARRV